MAHHQEDGSASLSMQNSQPLSSPPGMTGIKPMTGDREEGKAPTLTLAAMANSQRRTFWLQKAGCPHTLHCNPHGSQAGRQAIMGAQGGSCLSPAARREVNSTALFPKPLQALRAHVHPPAPHMLITPHSHGEDCHGHGEAHVHWATAWDFQLQKPHHSSGDAIH